MRKSDKTKKVNREKKRLMSILPEECQEMSEAVETLIDRMAFMKVTLELLEDDIKQNGPVIEFVNGSQEMMIENPAQKSYNTMIARYLAAFKQFISLFPKEEQKAMEDDGFDAFVGGRGD